jgi:anti-anti-sigma factor
MRTPASPSEGADTQERRCGLRVCRDADTATVYPHGELDVATAPRLNLLLAELRQEGARQVTVDLSGVTFLDTVGLRVLLDHDRLLRGRRGGLRVANPAAPIMRLLQVTCNAHLLDRPDEPTRPASQSQNTTAPTLTGSSPGGVGHNDLPAAAPVREGGVVEQPGAVMRLAPHLTDRCVDELRDDLYAAIRRHRWVTLEGRDVAVVSAAAIGVLVAAALLAQQLDGGVVLDAPSSALRTALSGYRGARDLFRVRLAPSEPINSVPIPPLPAGWRLDVATRPASPIGGGDVIACRHGADGRVHMVVLDVSGRGAQVARRGAALRRIIVRLLASRDPRQLLDKLNAYMLSRRRAEEFATAVHLAVDLASGWFEAASAGHPPVAVWHGGTQSWEVVPATGLLLGVFDDLDLRPVRRRIPRDGALLAYTDGAVERRGASLDGGLSWLLTNAATSLAGTDATPARHLVREIAASTDDDVTVAALHRSS